MQPHTLPSITVVIPTRERNDTLVATLRSCTLQRYEKLTILVVDNFSRDATPDVVASFTDPRVKYVRTTQRLAMSANWEFALAQVSSDYVMFLGDDDALMPNCIGELVGLIASNDGIEAISWPSVEYGWPNCPLAETRNLLIVPLRDGIERRATSAALRDVLAFRRPYAELPFLYKGVVSMKVVARLRAQSGGTVFHSRIPDVYFGIASCAVIDEYLFCSRPFTLNGASSHSNGTSAFGGPEGKEAERKFLSEDNLAFHPALVFCPSIPVLVLESLLQAQRLLPSLRQFALSFDDMLTAALRQIVHAPGFVFDEVKDALRRIATDASVSEATRKAVESAVNKPYHPTERVFGHDIFKQRWIINAAHFAIGDCYAASQLADSLWRLEKNRALTLRATWASAFGLLLRELTKRTGWFGRSATGLASAER